MVILTLKLHCVRLFHLLSQKVAKAPGAGGGGNPHMNGVGMLVGNFELDP